MMTPLHTCNDNCNDFALTSLPAVAPSISSMLSALARDPQNLHTDVPVARAVARISVVSAVAVCPLGDIGLLAHANQVSNAAIAVPVEPAADDSVLMQINHDLNTVRAFLVRGNRLMLHFPQMQLFLNVSVHFCGLRACDLEITHASSNGEQFVGNFISYSFEDAFDAMYITTFATREKCDIYLIDTARTVH